MSELSPQQQDVVDLRSGKVVVAAAAGSGKTRVLTERYVQHVLSDGLRPDQILTITFTRKAAANMKSKIVGRLREAGRLADAQIAETGPIQTIHSFCERMLRENALEAGLDPDFSVLDHSDILVNEAIWKTIAELDEDEAALDVVRLLVGRLEKGTTSAYSILLSMVKSALRGFRDSGHDLDETERLYESPESVLRIWEEKFIESLPEEVRRLIPVNDLPLQARVDDAWNMAKQLGIKGYHKVTVKITPEEELVAANHTCGLVRIACRAWRHIEREMDRQQVLDFAALERRAVGLVESSAATRSRLQHQYKALLVDESQDVNPMQYRLLDAMGIDVEMLVGDEKQSIFGFRQADRELFIARAEENTRLPLQRNYRSAPGILRYVDDVFREQFENYEPMFESGKVIDLQEVTERKYEGVEFWSIPGFDSIAIAEYVEQLLSEGVEAKDIALLARFGKAQARLQDALEARGIPARIVGGTERFYVRMEVRDLGNLLTALTDPSNDYALLCVLRSPLVGLTADSVISLANQKPILESLGSAFLANPEDHERLSFFLDWFVDLLGYADRIPAWEVLATAFERSRYWENLLRKRQGEQRLANVRKLFSIAATMPDVGARGFAQHLRSIRELNILEGDAAIRDENEQVVTIITVHKSKGLEWPVVVVTQTDHQPRGKSSSSLYAFEIDPRTGMAVACLGTKRSGYFDLIADRRREREKAEEWRVMYVALTRAKERLCLAIHPTGTGQTFGGLLAKTVGYKPGAPPPGIRIRED
ncbi:MAG TPA: UvrD-helicase domain-containing protein [Fimbriimonadaceae bacterium]|nr:UvrD-helicase domain-containing protein [Fimbriimonadaceae bacterium]